MLLKEACCNEANGTDLLILLNSFCLHIIANKDRL